MDLNANILDRFCEKFLINYKELIKLELDTRTHLVAGPFFFEVIKSRRIEGSENWVSWRFRAAQPVGESEKINLLAGIREFIGEMKAEFGLELVTEAPSMDLDEYNIGLKLVLSIQYNASDREKVQSIEITIWS